MNTDPRTSPAARTGPAVPRRALPLTTGEATWLASAAMVTALAVLMLVSGSLNVQTLLLSESSPNPPVHQALPDLCSVFPSRVADLELEPDRDSRDLDRSEARCSFTVTDEGGVQDGVQGAVRRSVEVTASRPEPASGDHSAEGELDAARSTFLKLSRDSPFRYGYEGQPPYRPLPGFGDEAWISVGANPADPDETNAAVLVRAGVMVVTVHYKGVADGDDRALLIPAVVEATMRELTDELLRRLPRD